MARRRRESIDELVREDRLARVEPDDGEVHDLLEHAEAHLSSASKIKDDDPAGAYQMLYDATRKAVSADMLHNGYRVKADKPRAHAAVVLYAEEALRGAANREALANFDTMRRNRNRTEYGAVTFGAEQIDTDLKHARALVAAVRSRVGDERA